ncbi:Transport permease protein [Cupriavidus taiwanensis]|uniref:Transport permease protein n=2 Tax=Cupriavidus taiwanensis TaxID=164546 RepID=A0A7Z7JBK5_9BURK|nr:ABC-2 type transporter [Cupriavidus taiwanensis]SOZ02964.1 ABC-2 type transporter [Cupriavidus taiwanensis]SOZ06239.1 ABC-2 type transporter [Cupriavidus taiwanensis]SPC18770.1 ABC-2 type transporter [Cupriavidus taiwanensis]SPD41135.1 Transport permease protein [Cupriavidus taiwanensis]
MSLSSHLPLSPQSMFLVVWRQRHLIWQMTRREIVGRYQGSIMGVLWSFLNPLCMLLVYTFVFSVVFQSHWGKDSPGGRGSFALILFAGLMTFSVFSEAITRAPGLVTSNVNYVKKVVFPLEILPIISLASVLFHALISFVILMLAFCLIVGMPSMTVLFFPLVLAPLVFFVLGVSWVLASIGVYLRDVQQTMTLLVTVTMFMTPIFYPLDALPMSFRRYLEFNPMTYFVDEARRVLVFGQPPHWPSLAIALPLSVGVAYLGYLWFQKTRPGFSDVL